MNRKAIIATTAAIILVGFGAWFAFLHPHTPVASNMNATSTPEAPVATSTNPLAGIDLSSLEKNTLYTEEEGKYSNLPKAGQELLWEALAPECVENLSGNYCNVWQEIIPESRIIAAKNNIFLFSVPTGKGSSYYVTYNALHEKLGQSLMYFGSQIENKTFVVYINNLPGQREELLYYRPGMTAFALVPRSSLSASESYWYYAGMGMQISQFSFNGNLLSISLFDSRGSSEMLAPKTNRTVSFDLGLL
ncbi:MAG TPA: hypothetical protein ENJ75_02995 [Candidatus Kaiserbacteria bacterium]|nr:hypothetical protein [Candidatus Kaiserbacteria bacterium]